MKITPNNHPTTLGFARYCLLLGVLIGIILGFIIAVNIW